MMWKKEGIALLEVISLFATLFKFAFWVLQVVFFAYGILAFRKYLGHGKPQIETQKDEKPEEE